MSLQMSLAPPDQVVDLPSIDLSGIDRRRLKRSKFADRFAEDGITLSLVHLDVALAVKAERRDAKDAADGVPSFKVSANASRRGQGISKRLLHRTNSKTPSFGAFLMRLRQRNSRTIPTPPFAPTPCASPS